jgi:hypothetical protein
MLHLERWRESALAVGLALVTALGVSLVSVQPTHAAESGKLESSVQFVPSDAAFYSVMLRNREQIEAVLGSQAWAKLKALPAVQVSWQMALAEINKPEGEFAEFMQLYNQPENRELVELLLDMQSQEVFFYGGHSWVDFVDLASRLMGSMRYGPALMQLQTGGRGDPSKMQLTALYKALAANAELIKAPDVIIGFKLSKTDHAQAQLKRLETLVKGVMKSHPEFKGRFERAKVAGRDFLTLTFDGSMVPWEEISFKDVEEKPGESAALVKKLKQLKLTLSLGIRDNYLLVSVGESPELLGKLGQGKGLTELREFKPLARFADKRLTSIDYMSKAFRTKVGTTKEDIDSLVDAAEQAIKGVDLPADKRGQVEKDLKELAKDLKSFIGETGAAFSFSFLTDRGEENYSYDWSEHRDLDSSKPLELLHHVGGSPLLAIVGRSKYSPENYQMLVKWIKKGNGYVEQVVENLDETKKAQYEQIAQVAHPLLRRLDEITGKMLLPALADGQAGLVLDAKIKSKQWFPGMPPTEHALPMLEPALIFGVSDEGLLRGAFDQYRVTANETIAKVREMVPLVPEFEIPPPESRKVKGGTLYYYPIPAFLGIDPQISPNAGVSNKVVVLTIAQRHSERLLARTALKTNGGPLADINRPLATAVYVDWPALVDTLTPWVEFGIHAGGVQKMFGEPTASKATKNQVASRDRVVLADSDEARQKEALQKATQDIAGQVRTVLEVLKVFRGYSSCSYLEDGVLVTHSEMVIRDLGTK